MPSRRFLAQVPLFAGLNPADLEALAASFRPRSYARGETIFRQEDPGGSCYVVETGRVKIAVTSADGKQVTLALLGSGELIGELALLDGAPRSADAVALETCQLLELHRDRFLDFLHAHHAAAIQLLGALAGRLRRTDELLEDAVFLRVPGRLAKVLLELAESGGHRTAAGAVIDRSLTQGELAALVGATRESVNKWLGYFQQRGLVQVDGGRIVVCRPEELRRQVS